MKIATFNANSIRARLKIILDWINKESPDVLCVQETKVQDHEFPLKEFENINYYCAFKGQKSYNGVAIISKIPFENVIHGFKDGDVKEEPRLITTLVNGITVVNSYIPQGTAPDSDRFKYKLDWFSRIKQFFTTFFKPSEPLIWTGDFNVAPETIDVYDPEKLLGEVSFHPDEHKALQKVKEWGFVDVFRLHQRDPHQYSFYDYRVPNAINRKIGWRIDHIFATECMASKSIRSWIDIRPRLLERPSDHTFVAAEFSW